MPFAILPAIAEAGEGGLPPSTLWTGIIIAWTVSALLTAKNPKVGLQLVALLGTGVSFYLAQQHYSDAPALCDAGDLYSCSTVNKSDYSEIAGIPIAFLGLGHFVAMGVLAMRANEKDEEYASAGALLFTSSVIAVLYSIVLAFISKSLIGAWCLFCISLYGLNTVGLFGAWKLKQPFSVGMFAGKSFGTAFGFFMGAMVLSAMVVVTPEDGKVQTKTVNGVEVIDVMSLLEATPVSMTLDGTEPVMGDRNAPIQLVEFADFECPHCAMVAPKLKELLASNPKVNLRFKHYPISNICNPNIGGEGHANACLAATSTDCAQKQGKFWEMNAIVFKNQNYLSRKDIEFLAEAQVQLDMAAFKACLDDESMLKGIQSDIAAAEAVGVKGTPSVYVKGIGTDKEAWYKLNGSVEQLKTALTTLP